MKFIDCFSDPYALSLATSKLWSMQSNALERSVKRAPVSPPPSRVLRHFSTLLRDNAVHLSLSETHTEIWRILFENIDRFDYTLVSHTLYLN